MEGMDGMLFFGVWNVVLCMNPLRLAALDASPFCFAKRGGPSD